MGQDRDAVFIRPVASHKEPGRRAAAPDAGPRAAPRGNATLSLPGRIEWSLAVIEKAPFHMDAQKPAILYHSAAPFLRLSGEDVAQYHGGRVFGHPFSWAAIRQQFGGSPVAARRLVQAHRPRASSRPVHPDRPVGSVAPSVSTSLTRIHEPCLNTSAGSSSPSRSSAGWRL